MAHRIDSFEDARTYTRRYAKTFYFASHVLPPEKRRASYAVYAFCRFADNVTDSTPGIRSAPNAALKELDRLRSDIRRLFDAPAEGDGTWAALRHTVLTYQIPAEYFLDLIRGVEMDLTRTRYETFDDLREYCYCVASVVGLVMTRIFGTSDPSAEQRAIDMGIAMQLTNILRDIGEDLELGRVYLPQEDLRRFGYGEHDLRDHVVDSRFRELMRYQLERARAYYASAQEGIPLITDDGSRFCARLMGGLYGKILDVIEENRFDVFSRRAFVPFPRKVLFAAQTALRR